MPRPPFIAIGLLSACVLAYEVLLAQLVPFNPRELLWDKPQPAKLLAVYLLMMLPFFCGGLGIGLVFSHFGKQAGRIYVFDIFGAGAGSLGVIVVLFLVPPPQVLTALMA